MLTDLEDALERLQQSDFECGDGSENQGPVAVVALETLGHPALIQFFVDVYVARLRPLSAGAPLGSEERTRALGDRARRADWLVTFEAEIAEFGTDATLEHWLPVLLPGAFSGGGGGVLRTAAALTAMARSDEAARRRELAFGLAAWASRHQRLPGEPGDRPQAGFTAARALTDFEGAASDRRRVGSLSEAVLVLEGDADFAALLATLDLGAQPPADAIVGIVEVLAELQLGHPEARAMYGRAISVAMGLHVLLPHAPGALHAELVGRAAQIALAVHAVYGRRAAEPARESNEDPERDLLAKDVGEIRYRAACSRDADAITLAEACLRAHAVGPAPVLLHAAADAALRFGMKRGGRGG